MKDKPKLREKIIKLAINTIMVGNVGGEITLHHLPELADQILALIIPQDKGALEKLIAEELRHHIDSFMTLTCGTGYLAEHIAKKLRKLYNDMV